MIDAAIDWAKEIKDKIGREIMHAKTRGMTK